MRYVLSVVLAITLVTAGTAHSHRGDRIRGGVSVEVISDSGAALLTIPHKDFWKGGTRIIENYLEAKKGEKHSLVIRNSSPERIGVVIAVDGRNIISGKKSDLKPTENMYIVDVNETGRYEGWRTDQEAQYTGSTSPSRAIPTAPGPSTTPRPWA